MGLNEISGLLEWPDTSRTVAILQRWKQRVAGTHAAARAAPRPRTAARNGGETLSFAIEPLAVPSLVRPEHEPHVLYVRLSARAGAHVSVLPSPFGAMTDELARARGEGRPVTRGVLVGADSILDPRALAAPGHGAALDRLVEVIRAFTTARVPFVWRTRGGVDGALPHGLGDALAAAGALALVELGVPTLDGDLCDALEGVDGVHPEHRLRLASALVARGIAVRGLVDPLVPMLTDQQQALDTLAAAFANAGVTRIGARYIVLTRERARTVASRLAGMRRALLDGVFADEPWHKPDPQTGQREVYKRIPAHLRRAGHHRLVEAAARQGVLVDVLDPAREGEDLRGRSDACSDGHAPGRTTDRARSPRRVRPQLDLFRKAR